MLKIFGIAGLLLCLMSPTGQARDLEVGLAAARAGDYETALREWRPLADQGHADAQAFLGAMYINGDGVARDPEEAARWYRLAADQG
ncbi:MAG: hypothetical protein RIR95_1083, partial [Pseudomonadota bacterium]